MSTLSTQLLRDYGRSFGLRSLRRMVQFADVFPEEAIVVALSQEISWSHFIEILPLKQPLEREYYAELCRVERWSVHTLREMERFLLELGVGFTFVERQKRISVGADDFYLDLLFYHRHLRRLAQMHQIRKSNQAAPDWRPLRGARRTAPHILALSFLSRGTEMRVGTLALYREQCHTVDGRTPYLE